MSGKRRAPGSDQLVHRTLGEHAKRLECATDTRIEQPRVVLGQVRVGIAPAECELTQRGQPWCGLQRRRDPLAKRRRIALERRTWCLRAPVRLLQRTATRDVA